MRWSTKAMFVGGAIMLAGVAVGLPLVSFYGVGVVLGTIIIRIWFGD